MTTGMKFFFFLGGLNKTIFTMGHTREGVSNPRNKKKKTVLVRLLVGAVTPCRTNNGCVKLQDKIDRERERDEEINEKIR